MSYIAEVKEFPEGDRASLRPEILRGGVGNRNAGADYPVDQTVFISYKVRLHSRTEGGRKASYRS
jgi:hypothetical protein